MADDRPLETTEEAVGRLDGKLADLESTLLARLSRRPVGDVELAIRGAPKPGTLFLQGQTLQRADYPDLWAWAEASGSVVAGGYGAGNGSTTFVLPDMRDRFLVGAGGTITLGGTGGAATRTLTTANLPAHDHSVSGSTGSDTHFHSGTTGGSGGNHGNHNTDYFNAAAGGVSLYTASTPFGNAAHEHGFTTGSDAHSHTLSITEASVGSGTGFDNRPPYLGINVAVWT